MKSLFLSSFLFLLVIYFERTIWKSFCSSRAIKVEIKGPSNTEKEKFVQFTVVETDRKGGKYRIVNCYPNKDPKKSKIKTIKTSYQLN